MDATRNQPRSRRAQKTHAEPRRSGAKGSSGASSRPEGSSAIQTSSPGAGRSTAGVMAPEGEALAIELSRAQVDQVLRAASGRRSMSALFSGLLASPERLAETLAEFDDKRLSRSLLAGLLVLAAFPDDGGHLGIGEVARLLGMNPSTAHRYITTLVEVGMLERDPGTRRYRLPR